MGQDLKLQKVKRLLGVTLWACILSLASAAAQTIPDALPHHESSAQSPQTAPAKQPDEKFFGLARRGVRDQKGIYSAPFHRKNLKWDALFLAVTGGLIAGDRHVTGAIPRDNPGVSRRISDVGLYSTMATTGAIFVSGIAGKNEHKTETGILGLEALANTAGVTAATQWIAGRERPLEGAGHGHFWVNNTVGSSFPSMHSSLTWSMASVLAREYPRPWVQFLAYGTAATVSVTRVTGLEHFPADVAAGGALGYLIGRYIFRTHSRFP